MKKHRVLLNMINNFITFLPKYCIYPGTPSFPVLTISMINTKIILMAIQKDVLPNQILNKDSEEKIDKFLKIPEEL